MSEPTRMLLIIFGIVWTVIIGGGYLWFSVWHQYNEGILPDYFFIIAPVIFIVPCLILWITRHQNTSAKKDNNIDEDKDDFVHYY